MKTDKKQIKHLSTDWIDIKNPDNDQDMYIHFEDKETRKKYQIYINIDTYLDCFKKSRFDKIINDYIENIKIYAEL